MLGRLSHLPPPIVPLAGEGSLSCDSGRTEYKARQGPALDGDRQGEPAEKIAEVVGDDALEQPDLVGPEPMTGEARPMGGRFPFLDPLLRRPALVVEANDGPVRPGQGGDDEAHPRKEFSEVMLDLGDDPPWRSRSGRLMCLTVTTAAPPSIATRSLPAVEREGDELRRGPREHPVEEDA